jgi:hypothetical protein
MIKENLVTRLGLDQPEQEIVEETLKNVVGEAVKTVLADHNPQNSWFVADSSPTVYDPGQSETAIPRTSHTPSVLSLNSTPPAIAWTTATPTSTVTSSEEELSHKARDDALLDHLFGIFAKDLEDEDIQI